jgi:hypothetical protein
MKTSMLEYYKLILDKVSFDRNLLIKEYKKALADLGHEESYHLKKWVQTKLDEPLQYQIEQ